MTEQVLYDLRMHSPREQVSRSRMAEVVKSDARQASLTQRSMKVSPLKSSILRVYSGTTLSAVTMEIPQPLKTSREIALVALEPARE